MRNFLQYLFLLNLVFLFSSPILAQEKRALIVAIGNYNPESKIPPIASLNDVKYIKAALHKNNFKDENIDTLKDEQATIKGIIAALDALIAKSKLNDIVVVHFSCHGQQIRDQKTIELGQDEDDGYDEALLAYDAMAKYKPGKYKGENHLRDDDLGKKLNAIRKNIGINGSLLVMLDACHSGTGTRDESFAVSRGEPIPFPDPENPLDGVINLGGFDKKMSFLDGINETASNMVTISASSPNQVNKQIKAGDEEVGSLSYSFYKAMSEVPAGSSYKYLFDKIRLSIQGNIPDQIPMIEGDGNQIIFSGSYAGSNTNIYASMIAKEPGDKTSNIFSIDRGSMDNMAEGIKCKVYRAGEKEVFTTAVIKRVETFRSIAQAEKILDATTLYEIVPEEENYGILIPALSIRTDGTDKSLAVIKNQVQSYLTKSNTVTLSDQADFQLDIKTVEGQEILNLRDRNNKLVWNTSFDKRDTLNEAGKASLSKKIKQEARIKYLRTLPDGGVFAPLVKASIIKDGSAEAATGLELGYGEKYALQIDNKSNESLYYTVLDIYPDNTVEILYPYKGKEPADYFVQSNASITRRLAVSQGSPKGVETLKIIVTKQPMDLRSVFENRITRAEMQSFQAVMDDVMNERSANSTRGEVANVKAEEIGIISASFIVK